MMADADLGDGTLIAGLLHKLRVVLMGKVPRDRPGIAIRLPVLRERRFTVARLHLTRIQRPSEDR